MIEALTAKAKHLSDYCAWSGLVSEGGVEPRTEDGDQPQKK